MTEPCREQVAVAFSARIETLGQGASPAITGLTVERERSDPVTPDDMPLIAVYDGDQVPAPNFAGEDGWDLSLVVQGLATGATALEARQAANRIEAHVLKVVMDPAGDPTMGIGIRDIQPEAEPRPLALVPDGDAPSAAFSLAFTVSYATAEGDPFNFA
ncbi:MAG: hypothetical protein ACM31D_04620 [Bacteroidota bacterium]